MNDAEARYHCLLLAGDDLNRAKKLSDFVLYGTINSGKTKPPAVKKKVK